MKTNKMYISFTHHELLEMIGVCRALKQVALQQYNRAEAKLMDELIEQLLDYDLDEHGTAVTLDRISRFALWSAMERYAAFCSDTCQYMEYAVAVTIMTKLQG